MIQKSDSLWNNAIFYNYRKTYPMLQRYKKKMRKPNFEMVIFTFFSDYLELNSPQAHCASQNHSPYNLSTEAVKGSAIGWKCGSSLSYIKGI